MILESVAPGVEAVVLPHPTHEWLAAEAMPVRAYVVGGPRGDEVALVDAGYAAPASVDAIAAALRDRPVAAVLLTHAHPDHGGGAAAIAARTGAPIRVHAAEASSYGADPALFARPIAPGETIDVAGRRLVAVAAPGHTHGGLAYHDPAAGLLFAGDSVLGEGTVVVGPPDGDMLAYLATLERLRALDPLATILPGHGPPVLDPRRKLDEYVRHRRLREAQVVALLEAGPVSADDVVAAHYAGAVLPSLLPLARISALGTLEKLVAEGRATRDGERYRPAAGSSPPVDVARPRP